MTYSVVNHTKLIPMFFKLITLILILRPSYSISVVVTPEILTINTVTIYDWNIGNLSGTTTSIILSFPSLTTFNETGVSVVLNSDRNPYAGSYLFTGNNISIAILPSFQLNNSLNFKVTNVRNPVYFFNDNAWVIKGA